MRKKSLQYRSCHEASHAVVAYLEGYVISGIRISQWDDPLLDDPGGGSYVGYELQSWTCDCCDRQIDNRNDPHLLSELDDQCPSCKEEKFRFIERCLAGGAGTELLEAAEHDAKDSECDNEQVGIIYPTCTQSRVDGFVVGLQRAQSRVAEVKNVICALRDELVRVGASMSGEQAIRFIADALSKQPS